jgi:hypothetical protein
MRCVTAIELKDMLDPCSRALVLSTYAPIIRALMTDWEAVRQVLGDAAVSKLEC